MSELLNELKALRDDWNAHIADPNFNVRGHQCEMGEESAYMRCIEDIDELIASYE